MKKQTAPITLTLDDIATAEQSMQLEGARNQKRNPQTHFVKAKTKTLFDTAKKFAAILDVTELPRNAEGDIKDNGEAVVRLILPPAPPAAPAPVRFAYSFDSDESAYTGDFETVEDAIEDARKEAVKYKIFENMEPGDKQFVYVGKKVPFVAAANVPTAEDVIDHVRGAIMDDVGSDFAEDYFDGGLPKEKADAITADLRLVTIAVFAANGIDLQPALFSVDDIGEHELVMPDAANDTGKDNAA